MKRLQPDGEPDSPNLRTDLIQVSAVYNPSLLCQGRLMSSVAYGSHFPPYDFKKKIMILLEYWDSISN